MTFDRTLRCLTMASLYLLAASGVAALDEESMPAWKRPPEELLREALVEFFDPGAPHDLRIESSSRARELQGRFESLRLSAQETSIQGMPIRSFRIELDDFQIDLPRLRRDGKIKVYSAARVSYEVQVSEQGLNWLLAHGHGGRSGPPPRMTLGDGSVRLEGTLAKGLLRTGFDVQGTIAAREEQEVHFIPADVSIGWFSLPGFVIDMIAERINPIATVGKFMALKRVGLKVKDVRVTPDALIVSG